MRKRKRQETRLKRGSRMKLWLENRTGSDVSGYEGIIRKVLGEALRVEGIRFEAEVNVIIVDDDAMRGYNKGYRGIDAVTDCLSFPIIDVKEIKRSARRKIPGRPKQAVALGDIILCLGQAERQAAEYGHGTEREMGFLAAHSMLHLLGYDHMNEEDERKMIAKQKMILT
jgi:probable rRNA maturation factor